MNRWDWIAFGVLSLIFIDALVILGGR